MRVEFPLLLVSLRIKLPQFLAGVRIQRDHSARWSREVHHTIDDQRRARKGCLEGRSAQSQI